ncbi:IS110 family RNA-guided transposase [Nocardioides terrigena]|uniref:IS110 family transposase n=1 Tax=Nocardioides terrigena TaxID=424797 RepID=UPI000D31CE68|nr:IS110 family transposase [Nocardioides terrigena]
MKLYVGNDWAEEHHDIALLDEEGRLLATRRLPEGVAGITTLHELIGQHTRHSEEPPQVVVGIETDRGPWVQALLAAGYLVYAVNPMSVARYRERHVTSGAKSDPADARVLADLVRTDAHRHRPIAGDTELAEAIKVLARSHQSLCWMRGQQANQLRSTLREFYPAALAAFDELTHPDALAVLAIAPTPAQGKRLTRAQITAALRRGGRRRYLSQRTEEIHAALRSEHLEQPPLVADAFGAGVTALVGVLTASIQATARLEQELEASFGRHPAAELIRSQPGLGTVLGARVLAEFGDDPARYADAKARKNYAGTSPITKASGQSHIVLARYKTNKRLRDALRQQAFSALTTSPGARTFYDAHRAAGDGHDKALRALANRLVGILHGCLKNHTNYDEHTAWAHRTATADPTAA